MSSVQDLIKCKQCGYKEADYLYYCRIGEDVTTCRRCGFHESWTAKRDQDGVPCGWLHEIDEGFGALFYRLKGAGGFANGCMRSANELAEAERWLRERLAKGEVEPQDSYLTRWNRETMQVELVVGEFYEWPESRVQDTAGDQQGEEDEVVPLPLRRTSNK
jgi:hypothetical protein